MRMDRAGWTGGPIVSAIGASGFRVDERHYRALLLTPEHAVEWSPEPLDRLHEHFPRDLVNTDPRPEFVLLGTGPTLRRPPASLVQMLDGLDIGVEAMDSRAAARAWSVLRGEGRRIAAILYPLE